CMKCSRTGKGWGPKGNGGRGGGRGSGGGGGDHDGLEGDVGATADAVDAYQAVMFGGAFDQGALEDVALMGAFLSAGGGPDLSNAPAAGFVTTAAGTPGGVPTPGERVAGWALVILSDASVAIILAPTFPLSVVAFSAATTGVAMHELVTAMQDAESVQSGLQSLSP